RGKGALSWLKLGKVLRTWEYQPPSPGERGGGDTVDPTVACPRCEHRNRRGTEVCQECGEIISGSDPGSGPAPEQWKQDLMFPLQFCQIAIRDYAWVIEPQKMQSLQAVVNQAQLALDINDESSGRLLKQPLENALNQTCAGFIDLVEASWIYRVGMGKPDQSLNLGNSLEEYKRRVLGGEDPNNPALQELRFVKIQGLVKEIMEGLDETGKVECENPPCHKMRRPPTPANPRCEHCGFNPFAIH
ncbi:MAG: hypothetical protein L0229_26715, partial [Blastocatellia bacterium]|nr:hypothetical protein [Blastocatellia bacterium]